MSMLFHMKSNYWIEFNSDTQPHHIEFHLLVDFHSSNSFRQRRKSIFSLFTCSLQFSEFSSQSHIDISHIHRMSCCRWSQRNVTQSRLLFLHKLYSLPFMLPPILYENKISNNSTNTSAYSSRTWKMSRMIFDIVNDDSSSTSFVHIHLLNISCYNLNQNMPRSPKRLLLIYFWCRKGVGEKGKGRVERLPQWFDFLSSSSNLDGVKKNIETSLRPRSTTEKNEIVPWFLVIDSFL